MEAAPGDAEAPAADEGLESAAADGELASVESVETEPVAAVPSIEVQAPDGGSNSSDAGAVLEPDATSAAATPAPDISVALQTDGADTAAPATTEAAPAAEEPALIEVWRPGRAEGRHRPRERRRDGRRSGRPDVPRRTSDAEAPPVAASGEASPSTEQPAAEAPGRSGRPHRHRHRGGERQGGRRDHPEGPPRERERPQQRPARFERREREKAPDPNSPFAKLAALKAQLEAEAKERR
jgi:ATP-dependent RNA helicase SUPV3L1/SUV3